MQKVLLFPVLAVWVCLLCCVPPPAQAAEKPGTELVMSQVARHNEEEQRFTDLLFTKYGKRDMTLPERVFFTYRTRFAGVDIFGKGGDAERSAFVAAFPDTPQGIEQVLALEARTFKAPMHDLVYALSVVAGNEGDGEAARKLALALKYGTHYISNYQRQKYERLLRELADAGPRE
jgi:hypothetical protein